MVTLSLPQESTVTVCESLTATVMRTESIDQIDGRDPYILIIIRYKWAHRFTPIVSMERWCAKEAENKPKYNLSHAFKTTPKNQFLEKKQQIF